METSPNQSLTLVAAVIGAAVLGSQAMTIGYGVGAVGDIAILMALFAFDDREIRSGGQSIAFAGAGSFCLLTPFQILANALSAAAPSDRPGWFMTAIWTAGTLLLFALDRFRMSSRGSLSLSDAGMTTGTAQPLAVAAMPASAYRPPAPRVEQNHPAPIPTGQAPILVTRSISVSEPASMPTAPASPQVAPSLVTSSVVTPTPTLAPMAPAESVPDVTAIPPGKEAVIYLNLVGEGLNVLRTVRAENLGRDYYRIADLMPQGEQWEFLPGQVVRCRKKSLSNGKHMVAYEEAPRA